MSDTRTNLARHMRVLQPHPKVLGFYDGRIPGLRLHGPEANWLDDGAIGLGICTYAVIDGPAALLYDTGTSPDHARAIRAHLAARGVREITVVLSHWHADHVAGNAVFADCEIIALARTAEHLAANKTRLETGTPPIAPLVMPSRLFTDRLDLRIGDTDIELRHADIHSDDACLLLLPAHRLLLAGDAFEDPITYVAEPARLAAHLADIARVETWDFDRILPDHGDPDLIAAGGYSRGLLTATRAYVTSLLACRTDPALARTPVQTWLASDLASGRIRWYPAYAEVHKNNLKRLGIASTQEDTPA